jgi:hypothetical protein
MLSFNASMTADGAASLRDEQKLLKAPLGRDLTRWQYLAGSRVDSIPELNSVTLQNERLLAAHAMHAS